MFKHNIITQPEIPESVAALWQHFILKRCGLYFNKGQLGYLYRCLWRRMSICRIWKYRNYYHHVASHPDGEGEWQHLLNLLLNNETSFFRHPPSFRAISEYVLPRLMQSKAEAGLKTISMWSAGCSTGQEVYSLAMAFMALTNPAWVNNGQSDTPWQAKIIGSDLSQPALRKAKQGCYNPNELRYMPELYRHHYLTSIKAKYGSHSQLYQIEERIQALVRFDSFNLTTLKQCNITAQDVIFCQNVLIYFRPKDRLEIVRQLCRCLNPGGYLFLAPGEVIDLKLQDIQTVSLPNILLYQRTSWR